MTLSIPARLQQLAEQQARRAGADNGHLRPHQVAPMRVTLSQQLLRRAQGWRRCHRHLRQRSAIRASTPRPSAPARAPAPGACRPAASHCAAPAPPGFRRRRVLLVRHGRRRRRCPRARSRRRRSAPSAPISTPDLAEAAADQRQPAGELGKIVALAVPGASAAAADRAVRQGARRPPAPCRRAGRASPPRRRTAARTGAGHSSCEPRQIAPQRLPPGARCGPPTRIGSASCMRVRPMISLSPNRCSR